MPVYGYKILPKAAPRVFDIEYFKSQFALLVKDVHRLTQFEIPHANPDTVGRIFQFVINGRYPDTREGLVGLEAFRQQLLAESHWASVSFNEQLGPYITVTLRHEGPPPGKTPEYKVKYCFADGFNFTTIVEIKRTDLPDGYPREDIYHWFILRDDELKKLSWIASGVKDDWDTRILKTPYTNVTYADLEFNKVRAVWKLNLTNGGFQSSVLLPVSPDDVDESVHAHIVNFLREEDAKR